MENNQIIKYEGDLLQKVTNAIGITNKLLNIDFRKIHVVHFDDHRIFLRGLELSLKSVLPNLHIVGFTNGYAALTYVENCYIKKERLDIVISGINQPDIDGFNFAKKVREMEKKYDEITPIIIVSMYVDIQNPLWPEFIKALENGLFNITLPKSVSPAEISERIISLLKVSNTPPFEHNLNSNEFNISQREKSLLTLLYKKYPTQEIIQKMGLSSRTIETIKSMMMKKFKVKNTHELLAYAKKNCLFD